MQINKEEKETSMKKFLITAVFAFVGVLAFSQEQDIIAGSSTNLEDTISADLVLIQGGTFIMGSPDDEEPYYRGNESPQRQVTVSSFYMGRYEVTQREYETVMGTNRSNYLGQNLPVHSVSWYEAIEYCNRLSQLEGLTPAYIIDKSRSDPNNRSEYDTVRWLVTWNRNANGYRLPTEAEWEYACRAGTTTPFNTGINIPYDSNVITVVGNFFPNPWGLFDMHGNVWEWCWDWYGDYPSGMQIDPTGAHSGSSRILRGGSMANPTFMWRSAARSSSPPETNGYLLGFRVVRNAN